MAANDMSLTIIYESGSIETISAPDLSFNEGRVIQDEYVELGEPDRGIFWDRNAVDADHGGDVDATDADEVADAMHPFGQVHQRVCVVPPDVMGSVLAVFVKTSLALVRDPASPNACGLTNVLVESMLGGGGLGDMEPDVGFSPEDFPEEGMPPY